MITNGTILVTGASGDLGELILEELLKAGQRDLVAMPRSWKTVARFSSRGVDIKWGDFYDPVAVVESFRGVTTLLLMSTLNFGARFAQNRNAIEAARKAGVRHIVYTSCRKPAMPWAAPAEQRETEKLIKASGLMYTFLRNCLFAESLQFTLPRALQTGELYGCAGEGRIAYGDTAGLCRCRGRRLAARREI